MRLRAVTRMLDSDVEELLARVDKIADTLARTNAESEKLQTLAPDAVDALRQSGLFYMRTATDVGGLESSPIAQMAVFAAVAKLNPSAGWSLMVGNGGNSMLSTTFDDAMVKEIFGGRSHVISAGVTMPAGRAERGEGGYYVSGRWRFASGLPHSDYVVCNPRLDDDPSQPVAVALRRDQVQLANNWNAFGLRGSGSGDFIVDRAWVPDALARRGAITELVDQPRRGGALFRMPAATKVTYEHTGLALGMGERALEMLRDVVNTRVQSNGTRLASRDEVVYLMGKLATQLDAASAQAVLVHHQIFQHLRRGEQVPSLLVSAALPCVCHATQTALEIAQHTFRLTGSAALFEPSEISQLLRDLTAASGHVRASDDSFYNFGRSIMNPEATASYYLKPRENRS